MRIFKSKSLSTLFLLGIVSSMTGGCCTSHCAKFCDRFFPAKNACSSCCTSQNVCCMSENVCCEQPVLVGQTVSQPVVMQPAMQNQYVVNSPPVVQSQPVFPSQPMNQQFVTQQIPVQTQSPQMISGSCAGGNSIDQPLLMEIPPEQQAEKKGFFKRVFGRD